MSEDKYIRINLVDDWYKLKASGYIYPLRIEDQRIVDKIYDKIYDDGKLNWILRPTLFSYPVFVV